MQDEHPLAYTSMALTPTEIEKELLAIVFGVEHFEGYVFGRKILIDTDHNCKPLESIMNISQSIECTKSIAENAVASTEI